MFGCMSLACNNYHACDSLASPNCRVLLLWCFSRLQPLLVVLCFWGFLPSVSSSGCGILLHYLKARWLTFPDLNLPLFAPFSWIPSLCISLCIPIWPSDIYCWWMVCVLGYGIYTSALKFFFERRILRPSPLPCGGSWWCPRLLFWGFSLQTTQCFCH